MLRNLWRHCILTRAKTASDLETQILLIMRDYDSVCDGCDGAVHSSQTKETGIVLSE
jgi:hypothetical protein